MGDRLVEYIKENKLEAFRRAMKSHERFDLDSSSCLHWAVLSVRIEMVEILLACGADVNHPGLYNYQTPLYVAISIAGDQRTELIKLLLGAGANPNIGIAKPIATEDPQTLEPHIQIEATPLIKLVDVGDKGCVTLLIKAGADANLSDADGYTPLIMAIERSNEDLVKLLLASGASIEVNSPSGSSAFDMASERIQHILSTHRATGTGKKPKHAHGKKGWFGGLFKAGGKTSDDSSPRDKHEKRTSVAASAPSTPETSGKRTETNCKQSNGKSSDKAAGYTNGATEISATYNSESVTTPITKLNLEPVVNSTPYTSPHKNATSSPFTPNNATSNATPQNNTADNYITVAEHNRQMSALEKRIVALERKLEVQNDLLDHQAEQLAVLLSIKSKLQSY